MTTETRTPCGYQTRHEIRDAAKVEAIKASLVSDGWLGAPVVIWQGGVATAVTGTHRLAACEGLDVRPQTIDLAEVFAEGGLSLREIEAETDYDLACIIQYLPADLARKYGIEQ